MNFEIRLVAKNLSPLAVTTATAYDDELDDVRSILRDVCRIMEDMCCIQFRVMICTSIPWPVTIQTDLCVVMEQLPDVLKAICSHSVAKIEFYEQGIERSVLFIPREDRMLVQCKALVAMNLCPLDTMILDRRIVVDELAALARDFVSFAEICCSQLAHHPWFREWTADLWNAAAHAVNACSGVGDKDDS